MIKFIKKYFYMSPLYFAMIKDKIEIVDLLLSNKNIDVNAGYIFEINLFLAFRILLF